VPRRLTSVQHGWGRVVSAFMILGIAVMAALASPVGGLIAL
jgi:hypothetical protein